MSDDNLTADFQPGGQGRRADVSVTGSTIGQGEKIGNYKILSELGEGGCGVVYLAEREKPIRSRVALKVIKPGMDSGQVIARFEAERQALALMDHPNVARIFDGGVSEQGRPYFVMEYVKGIPITEHCDRQKLGIKERLELFIQVCDAVQHAHQKGIIHRDLKPSNILLTIHGNRSIPKVIDFGLAKAMLQPLTERTLFTEQGHLLGTPEYMSPEQAEMTNQDIDTRTDIYSLGVVLYELLTGSLPFDADYLRIGGLEHIRRVIREEEPVTPSTRISTIEGERMTQLTQSRHSDLRELKRELKGDLDWITLKAMEKDRTRRYETTNGLAADVKRYLASEPVAARPPSAMYRLRKLARRNKAAFVASAAVLTSLVVGLLLASWGFVQANYHRNIAQTERDNARLSQAQAEEQRDSAREARQVAEQAKSESAARARALERQVYLMRLTNVETAGSIGDWGQVELELDACPETQRNWEWKYLQRRISARFPLKIRGSQAPIFADDGKRLIAIGLAGPEDRFVRVWDIETGNQLLEFENESAVAIIALSPDENSLACGTYEHDLFVWDLKTGEKKWSDHSHTDRFDGLAFSPDGGKIATANWDATAKVFDAESGRLIHSAGPFKAPCRKVMYSPDGKWLAVGMARNGPNSSDSCVIVEASSGKIVATFPGREYSIPTFSPDGELVATANENGSVSMWQWDGEILTAMESWKASETGVASMGFSNDGKLLATGCWHSGFVKIWDASTGGEVASLPVNEGVYWLTISPDSKNIAIYTVSGGIRLWQFSQRSDSLLTRVQGDVWTVRFSPDNTKILVGSWTEDDSASSIVVDAESGTKLLTLDAWSDGGSWASDGKNIVVSNATDHTIALLNAETGAVTKSFAGQTDWAMPRVGRLGKHLTSVSGHGTIMRWNLSSGKSQSWIHRDNDRYRYDSLIADICPDGDLVAVAPNGEFLINIWDTRERGVPKTIHIPGVSRIESIVFGKNQRNFYFGGSGGTLSKIDVETGNRLKDFQGHDDSVIAIAISPDDRNIVSADTTGRLILWDVESAHTLFTLENEKGEVFRCLDWSSDMSRIVGGTLEGSVKLWTVVE